MSEPAVTRTVVVSNRAGIHARAATMIAAAVRDLQAKVSVTKGLQQVEATDVLQLLSLGAAPGETLTLEAAGPDAARAIDLLEQMFVRKFDEE
ncbi:MAG: HPr family phosphocarrier protein [Thermoguttaceae bacterium]|jgi:phosphotransferase system HPr (HPr) family protein